MIICKRLQKVDTPSNQQTFNAGSLFLKTDMRYFLYAFDVILYARQDVFNVRS